MEIREQHNLFSLLIESFALLNRCGGAIVGYVAAILLFLAAEGVLVWAGVPTFMIKLANIFFGAYFSVVLFRIFGAKAERTDESVSNSLSAAIFPAIYQILFNILYAIILFVFGVAMMFFLRGSQQISTWGMQIATQTAEPATYISAALLLLALMAVPGYIFARFMYAPVAIALRDQNPVDAMRYSFQLTSGSHIFTAIGAMLIIFLLPGLFWAALLYGGYVTIPLYFADSFNIAHLSPVWIGVFCAIGVIYLLLLLAMPAFWVLVFLNQDYGHNRDSFTPKAELKINNQEMQVFGHNNNVLPPGAGNIVRPEDVVGVQVLSSSVSAKSIDSVTQQHLDQVYQPKPEDLVQYAGDEDRMPTILFDDDMARQIEQERAQWENKQKQDKIQRDDDDVSSVKMSK